MIDNDLGIVGDNDNSLNINNGNDATDQQIGSSADGSSGNQVDTASDIGDASEISESGTVINGGSTNGI